MEKIPVVILGLGGVGRALMRQLVAGRMVARERAAVEFQVIAVADSRSIAKGDPVLSDDDILSLVERKQRGQPLADDSQHAGVEVIPVLEDHERGLLIDVTASNGMEDILDGALSRNWGVVLANKKPLTGLWQECCHYYSHPALRHESTVGGGQPVVATLKTLMDSNDEIRGIEGQMSGTLGFICQRMDDGMRFSEALRLAHENGFTEPDPREDLAGHDVARKSLILGRMAGWEMERDDLDVEQLYPESMATLSVDEFMNRAGDIDDLLAERVAAAAGVGKVLRYIAAVEDGRGHIGLAEVPAGAATANLKYVSFRTMRYDDEPLLIGGKGAGVEMTAAGVVGDMVSLVRQR